MVKVTNIKVEYTRQYFQSPSSISLELPSPEDGDSILHWNISTYLPVNMK